MVKKILKIGGIVLLILLVIVAGYAAYLYISYDRIADYQDLEVTGDASKGVLPAGEELTVVSNNLGFGAYTPEFTFFMDGGIQSRAESEESVRATIKKASDTLSGFNPDMILIQEVDTDSTRSYQVNELEMLQKAFPGYANTYAVNYHSAFIMYPLYQPHGFSNSGIATFSRYPIDSGLRRSLPVTTGLSKIVDLDRCYSVSRIPVDNGKDLVVYNVHLSAYGGNGEIKSSQIKTLFSDMKAEYEKGNYCIAGGDFNTDFTGNSIAVLNTGEEKKDWHMPFPDKLIPEGIVKCVNYSCGEQKPTLRSCDIPYQPGNATSIVDGFFVSDNIDVTYLENVQTGFAYSDHNPVLIRIILK